LKKFFKENISGTKNLFKVSSNVGFFHLISSNFAIKVFGFASQIFVAWILTPTDLGRIKVWQSFLSISLITASFGFESSTLKLCSEDRTNEEKYLLYTKAVRYAFPFLLITYVIIVLLSHFGVLSPDKAVNNYTWLFFIALFPLTINGIQLSYLRALKKIKEYANIQVITKAISIVFIIGLTYFFYLSGYLVALILGYFLSFILIKRLVTKNSYKTTHAVKSTLLKTHLKYSIPVVIDDFAGMVRQNLDILILNFIILSRDEVGYYSFASILITMMTVISNSMYQIVVPYFSEKSESISKIIAMFKKYEKKWAFFSLLIMILAILFTVPFLTYVMNGKYINSIKFFIPLAVAWFFKSILSFLAGALFGMGKMRFLAVFSIISVIVTSLFLWITISHYGIIGAAYGMMFAALFNLFIIEFFFRRKYKVDLLK
jgi:O-antigen/teichoic acid export membrane protein